LKYIICVFLAHTFLSAKGQVEKNPYQQAINAVKKDCSFIDSTLNSEKGRRACDFFYSSELDYMSFPIGDTLFVNSYFKGLSKEVISDSILSLELDTVLETKKDFQAYLASAEQPSDPNYGVIFSEISGSLLNVIVVPYTERFKYYSTFLGTGIEYTFWVSEHGAIIQFTKVEVCYN
jgi:hypothetical protein